MGEGDVGMALRETLWVIVKLGGPLLMVGLVVGTLISLIQAVTQVNEATLAFLPKLLALGVAMALMGPFMLATLTDYTRVLADRMIQVGGQ